MPYVTTAERIGIQRAKKEAAKNLLLQKILTDEQIANVTGLDREEICHLKENMGSGAEDYA